MTRHQHVVALTFVAMQVRFRSPFRNRAVVATLMVAAASLTILHAAGPASAQDPVATQSCPEQETQVAVFKEAKRGAEIVVYTDPSTAGAALSRVKTGINVFGRVVFRVLATEGDFLKVMPPARPNGSIGYIRKDLVDTYATPYRVEIAVTSRTLKVYQCGVQIISGKIAVGKAKAPTPTGSFFLVDLIRPRFGASGAYGPYAFGLSGFSKVYQKYGAGDGRIGIHGTNKTALLGTAVSDGCIRIDNVTITKMAKTLYLGSPVDVTNT